MRSILFSLFLMMTFQDSTAREPVKVAVAGLSHGHVDWIFESDESQLVIVGIYEENEDLVRRYQERYGLDPKLFYRDLGEMLDQAKPEAVTAFGAVNDHLKVVQAAAPRKVHVMVEKPMATTLADAREMEKLAKQHGIYVLTNFETSWYVSNRVVKEMLEKGALGEVKKVLVNAGHRGPMEIGVSEEFLEILIDPEKNGAGALVDFGCYGASLMTWLLNGKRPLSVTAVTNTNKPEVYKQVDDESTIVLQYPEAQAVVQGSWNWPFSRKDMTVYGTEGYAIAADPVTVITRAGEEAPEEISRLDPRREPYQDPFLYLAAVVRGEIVVEENDLYGLPVNVIVAEILEAAIRSAGEGKTIFLEH